MADTIRDVIIKLRIQQVSTKLSVPDDKDYRDGILNAERFAVDSANRIKEAWSRSTDKPKETENNGEDDAASKAKSAAERVAAAEHKRAESIKKAASTTTAAKTAESRASVSSSQTVVTAAAQSINAESTKSRSIQASSDTTVEAFRNQAEVAEMASAQTSLGATAAAISVSSSATSIQGSSIKIGDSLKQAGEGTFVAARGYALLFTSTDEGYQNLIRNIQNTQGVFDLAKGTYETMKALSAAYATASAAAAAAQTAVAVTAVPAAAGQGAVAATATAGSVSGGAYSVVMFVVAVAQTAVAVTAKAAAAAMSRLWGPVAAVIAIVTAAVTAAIIVWQAYAASCKEAAKAMQPVEDSMRKAGHALREQNQAASELDLQDQIKQLKEYGTASEKLANLPKRRAANKDLFEENRGATAGQIATGQLDEAGKSVSLMESQLSMTQQAAEREKDRLGLIREAGKELQNNLDKQKSILETAKQAYEQEKGRVASLQESLGKLNAVQQAELKRLGDKVKSGEELNDLEAERVGELGGQVGQEYTKERNRKKGEGKEDLLTPFNNGKSLTGQGSKLQEELDKYKNATDETAKLTQETLKKAAELKIQEQQQMTEVARLLKEVYAEKSAIENLKLFLENQQRDQSKKDMGKKQ